MADTQNRRPNPHDRGLSAQWVDPITKAAVRELADRLGVSQTEAVAQAVDTALMLHPRSTDSL
jgi:hypothetical protein